MSNWIEIHAWSWTVAAKLCLPFRFHYLIKTDIIIFVALLPEISTSVAIHDILIDMLCIEFAENAIQRPVLLWREMKVCVPKRALNSLHSREALNFWRIDISPRLFHISCRLYRNIIYTNFNYWKITNLTFCCTFTPAGLSSCYRPMAEYNTMLRFVELWQFNSSKMKFNTVFNCSHRSWWALFRDRRHWVHRGGRVQGQHTAL
jgi:hypothetical protein